MPSGNQDLCCEPSDPPTTPGKGQGALHATPDTLMRPDDADAFRHALRSVGRRSSLPILFGGPVTPAGTLKLTHFLGVRTAGLRGLHVRADAGLGGRVLASRRPTGVSDYRTARSITHDYDGPVLAEGIRSVLAVPVVVSDQVRGVLYGAARDAFSVGGRAADVVVEAARGLAEELAVRDEVDRRVRLLHAAGSNTPAPAAPVPTAEYRDLHAELRRIAQAVEDDDLRARLRDVSRRLAGLGAPPTSSLPSPLSPRELDVLTEVALGCTNAEAARRLSLLPETAKAYLRSAMRKLDARTRFEAVVEARRRGLLP